MDFSVRVHEITGHFCFIVKVTVVLWVEHHCLYHNNKIKLLFNKNKMHKAFYFPVLPRGKAYIVVVHGPTCFSITEVQATQWFLQTHTKNDLCFRLLERWNLCQSQDLNAFLLMQLLGVCSGYYFFYLN